MKRVCLLSAVLYAYAGGAGALQAAPAAKFPVPRSIPFQIAPAPSAPPSNRQDSVGAMIEAAPHFVPAPRAKPQSGAEAGETQPQKQDFIRQQILQAEPAARSRAQPNRAEPPEPSVSAPSVTVPVPVPMPAPLPEPLLPPSAADAVAPQAAPYEAAPQAPLTYTQSPQNNRSYPRFGDRRPHIWISRRKPWQYAIHGTDVSWHNKTIDWSAMTRSGISFVFIKATEGGDYADPSFRQNWRAAQEAGLARGAYHFYYFCRPVRDQLRWFIRNVPRDRNALPPVLDMEWNHTSPTCRRRPRPAQVRKDMRIFLQGLERHYGKKPLIYTSVDFFRDNDLQSFNTYPFWLRSTAAHPDDRYKNHPWLFWQYTGTGHIPGISGDADINVFVGNAKQWRSWLQIMRR